MSNRGILFVVSAPSGTGKTTLCQALLKLMPQMHYSISATTRPPRPGEKDGLDYFFLSEKDFLEKAKRGDFLEHAKVYDYLYGTPRGEVERHLDAGQDVLLDVDVQGARSIRDKKAPAVFVFIVPPDLATLEERLRKRQTDSADSIRKRLAQAQEELKLYGLYDYVVVNERVEESLQKIKSIVVAEKSRLDRNRGWFDKILSVKKS